MQNAAPNEVPNLDPKEPVSAESLRCRFTFKDGRRCKLPLHNHAVGFCLMHEQHIKSVASAEASEIADQLLGDVTSIDNVPEINEVLSRLFVLVAQKRIARQDGELLAHVASLLLKGFLRQDRINEARSKPRIEYVWDILPEQPANSPDDESGEDDTEEPSN